MKELFIWLGVVIILYGAWGLFLLIPYGENFFHGALIGAVASFVTVTLSRA